MSAFLWKTPVQDGLLMLHIKTTVHGQKAVDGASHGGARVKIGLACHVELTEEMTLGENFCVLANVLKEKPPSKQTFL